MTTEKKDGLAVYAPVTLAVMDPDKGIDLSEIAAELGGTETVSPLSLLSRVKMPKGDGRTFEIANPEDENDPEVAKEIVGVIVAHHPVNAYYSTSYDEEPGKRPDCASSDGVTGYGKRGPQDDNLDAAIGHACKDCPLNEFGSDSSGGKACTNRRNVYIVREEDTVPILLSLPPTSLTNFRNYVAKLMVHAHARPSDVLTRISVEVKDGKGKAAFASAGKLPPEVAEFVRHYGENLRAFSMAASPGDFAEAHDDGETVAF